MLRKVAICLLCLTVPAPAQDADTMQKVITAIQRQRNDANDRAAAAEAKALQLDEEVKRLREQLTKVTPTPKDKPDAENHPSTTLDPGNSLSPR